MGLAPAGRSAADPLPVQAGRSGGSRIGSLQPLSGYLRLVGTVKATACFTVPQPDSAATRTQLRGDAWRPQ